MMFINKIFNKFMIYFLMCAAMTYNFGLIMAITLGFTLGYLVRVLI